LVLWTAGACLTKFGVFARQAIITSGTIRKAAILLLTVLTRTARQIEIRTFSRSIENKMEWRGNKKKKKRKEKRKKRKNHETRG
jgi:hypothetical protein